MQSTACILSSRRPVDHEPLTREFVKGSLRSVLDVEVIEDPAGAVVALDPVHARLLAELAEPRSAPHSPTS